MANETSTIQTATTKHFGMAALIAAVIATTVCGGLHYYFAKAPTCPVWIQRDSSGVCWYVPGDGTKTKLTSCPPGCQ